MPWDKEELEVRTAVQTFLNKWYIKNCRWLDNLLANEELESKTCYNYGTVIMPILDGGFKLGSRIYRNYVCHNYGVTESV